MVVFHEIGQAFGILQRGNSSDFDVTHLHEGAGVKVRHESGANDTQFESGHYSLLECVFKRQSNL
jgi:hypothetical protein